MSDGAPAAPVAAAPPQATPSQQPGKNAPPAAKAAPAKETAAPPQWGEKDDAEFFERLKRSPYGRLKADGKEETLDSPDALKRALLDAQRGRGANRLVEESKKAKAEAATTAAEAKTLKDVVERARRGDARALRELGLVPESEDNAAREEFEALPPGVQQLVKQNHEMQQRLRQHEEAVANAARESEAAAKKAERDGVLATAKSYAKEVLSDIKEEFYDSELPDVLMAMEELKRSGMRYNREFDVSYLREYIGQQQERTVFSRLDKMKPDALLKRVAPLLKSLPPSEISALIASDPSALAMIKNIVRAWNEHNGRAAKAKTTANTQQRQTEEKPAAPVRAPMPARRW